MQALLKENLVLQTVSVYEPADREVRLPMRLNMSGVVEISLVTEGHGTHRVLNDTVDCRPGDLFILDGGIPHGYASQGEETMKVCTLLFRPSLVLTGEQADPGSLQYCYGVFPDRVPISCAALNQHAMRHMQEHLDAICNEVIDKAQSWEAVVCSRLTVLLIMLARYINMAQVTHIARPKEWPAVSAAMRAVLDGCSDSAMTLETIASMLYLSPSRLSRMFRKVTGEAFADYVRNVRVSMACTLLRTTSLTNEEIVSRCGLKDVPSFYKIFKSQMGMTPYHYRMAQQTYKGETTMGIYLEISENLRNGKWKKVRELVQQAISEGLPAAQILNEGLLAGMNVLGEEFKNGEVYVPDVLVAARAMNAGLQELKPLLKEDGVQAVGKVCIGTVQGDLHDIGKNMVKMMMEGKGLEVVDLGVDVAPETFVNTAIAENCQVICCSALLTTTMDVMADVVKCAVEAGIRDKVKIMVGGAPITEAFCREIGADCYTSDAASAADAAVELCRA